jgi:hypothetical protein
MSLNDGVEPPGLSAASQRVRSASVLLERGVDAEAWAKEALVDGLEKEVWTV